MQRMPGTAHCTGPQITTQPVSSSSLPVCQNLLWDTHGCHVLISRSGSPLPSSMYVLCTARGCNAISPLRRRTNLRLTRCRAGVEERGNEGPSRREKWSDSAGERLTIFVNATARLLVLCAAAHRTGAGVDAFMLHATEPPSPFWPTTR